MKTEVVRLAKAIELAMAAKLVPGGDYVAVIFTHDEKGELAKCSWGFCGSSAKAKEAMLKVIEGIDRSS